ncbi:MAG: HAMP domain-containing histidine kinase [Desulfobacteraceae bacterium]|nr:HAMP domain-containing histidine kinase [Desulfobacteraceae bacterium]
MTLPIYKKIFIPFFLTNCCFILVVCFCGQSGIFSDEKNVSIFIIVSTIVCYTACFWSAKIFTSQIRSTEKVIKQIVDNENFSDSIKTNSDGDEISSICHSVNALLLKIHNSNEKQLEIEKQNKKWAQFSAIAQTTRMIAHDVRRPFSMIDGILWRLENTDDPDQLVALSKKYSLDVRQTLASVDAMIKDILEIGRTVELEKSPVSPESIIMISLTEAFRAFQKNNVKVSYDLNHEHMINVDGLRLQRVLSNIFMNAIQAMTGPESTLWIKTQEDLTKNINTFCIGNSGSFIPKQDLSQIFDAFYTTNKSDGTGLGLSIAEKIIMEHEGQIWCESSKEKQTVEFYFTLPIAEGIKNKKTANVCPSRTC